MIWHDRLTRMVDAFGPMTADAKPYFSGGYRWIIKLDREGLADFWVGFCENKTYKDWASLDLIADGPIWNPTCLDREEPIKGFNDPRAVWLRFVTWGSDPTKEDWAKRYPHVPYERRVEFVFWHEIGHILRGSKESHADRYACENLDLPYMGLPEGMPDRDPSAMFLLHRPV